MKIISSKTLGKEFVTTEELSYGFPNDMKFKATYSYLILF